MDFEAEVLNCLNRADLVAPKIEPTRRVRDRPPYFFPSPGDRLEYISAFLRHTESGFLRLLKKSSFMSINHTSTEPFYTFGMITSVTGAKIDDNCYILNTEDGSNTLVKLNLDNLKEYSLVKGQAVALKARNVAGNELIVEKVYAHSVLEKNVAANKNVTLFVLAGPLKKDHMNWLAGKAMESLGAVIVVLGPLSHDEDLGELRAYVSELVKRYYLASFLFVPSLDDRGFIKVIPQPGFEAVSQRLFFSDNPDSFFINGHSVSLMNYDVLKELEEEELCKVAAVEEEDTKKKTVRIVPSDKEERLFHHLVFRRSYLPVFPSKMAVAYGKWALVDHSSDILITRSELPPFAKGVGCTFCVNTGNLSGSGFVIRSKRSSSRQTEYEAEFFKIPD